MDKYFSGKIRCIKSCSILFTLEKVYDVKNGKVYCDRKYTETTNAKTIDEINACFLSQFELFEEPDFQKSLEHIENVIQEFSYLEEKTTKQKL